jgi:hypothetical protein
VFAVSALVDCVPLVASLPDQPPEAAQEVASRADHVRLVAVPADTLVGSAVRATEGAPLVDPSTELVLAPPDPEPPHADRIDAVSITTNQRLIIPAHSRDLSFGPTDASVDDPRVNVATRLCQATVIHRKNFKTDSLSVKYLQIKLFISVDYVNYLDKIL